jgi:PAS domain S-box-containing protein
MNFPGSTGRRTGLGFMLVFAFMAAGILATGDLYYRNYERNYRAEAERQLSSIADLKVNELVQYRKERLGDANTFYNNPAFSELVRRFLDQPADADAQRQLQSWLGKFQAYYGYARINLFDVQGAERLAVPNQPEPLPGYLARDIAAVLRSGQVTFLDFHRDAPGLSIHLEILVPIFDRLDTNRPLGVLILRINPAVLLYPYIRRWPVPSQTAETLLVRREGNEAVYLNELRFQTNAALNLRIPLANTNVPAVKAALGQTGIVAGRDYRGVPVIADVRAVPNSPWFLVTRQDVAEVFAPVRERLWQVIVMIGVLLFGSAAGVGLVWRQQHVWFYRAKYEAEAFRAKLGAIVESSEYAIISKNLDGIITSWNPSAERIYGYSAAEAIGKSIGILIPPGHPNELPQLIEKIKRGEAVEYYETGRIRKNGERIQVSLSLSPVKNEAGAIVGVSVISFDITERKRAEEALRESEARYHAMLEQAVDAVFVHDKTGRVLDVNRKACQSLGYSREELLAKSIGDIDPEAIQAGKHELWDKILAGEHFTFESHQRCKDGSSIPVEVSLGSVRLQRGPVILSFARNIIERKRAETELRESEARFHRLSDATFEAVTIHKRGVLLNANDQYFKMFGYTPDELLGKQALPLTVAPEALAYMMKQVESGGLGPYESIGVRKDGTRFPMEIRVREAEHEGQRIRVGAIRDITERKRAEEALRESRALYFSLAEQLPIGVFRKDREGRYVLVNPEFCRLKGMKAEDFLGKTPREVAAVEAAKQGEMGLATKYAATGIEHHEQILRSGKPIELVEEYAHADGRKQFLRVLKSPVMGPDGKIIGSQGIQLDITARKLAEETIAHERQLLRTLIDLLPETFYIKDLDSRFLVANEALAKQWGKASPSQLMGLSDADLFPAGQAAQYLDEDRKVFAGEPLMGREGVCVFADGREHMVLTTKVPYRDIQGRICGLVGFGYDITERKRAEEALRAKEEAYRQLFDAGPDGVILIGPDARIVRANVAMARMYGYDSPDDLVGVCPTQFVAPSSREYSEQILRRRLNGEDIKQVEYELVRKDGTTFYGETLATILRNEDGTVTGYICITRDTTERKRAELALKESEVRYQRITEVITDYIYNVRVADGRAVETTHGPGCLAVTGYQAKEFANDPFLWFRMVAAEDRSKVEEQARRILAGEDPPPIEHRIVQKNGTERWVRNTFVPHRDERGVLATYDGLIQDITGRKQAEEEVARTAREWQATFDATKDAIWILDPNHQVLRSNKTAEQFFHRPCCEMIGKPCWEIVHGATEPIPDCPFVRSRKSLHRETMNLQIGERWFEVIVDPILDAAGQYAGAVHIVSDITERKRAEERIREQAALLDAANDAIYVRSLADAMTYWNDGAERLYGWTRAEVLGRKIHDLIQYDRDAFETAQAALLDQGYWSGELKMTDKTGKAVIVFCRWTLLLDESGRPKEVLAINTDITERKQLEANFLRAQRMEGIGALAGGIAHDLNNILQPILMTAPLLRETAGDPESREMLDTVENCAQRGANIIKQLLTFARGEPSARVPLPVRHLLNEMNKLIQETFPKNIQLRVNVPKNLWQVLGDATQIHQALMNLCVNARDAMSNGGTLTLAAENLTLDEAFAAMMPGAKPGPYICVSVADTGMGIPPEHLDRIFDPFFTTKEIGKGTGLGLATVLGIARGHGGFVRVNSQTGKGTTFELYLPASPEAKAAARPKCETLPPRAGGELILVVDDEANVRGVVRRALEKHGYQVATAAEGVEAMGLFAQHRAEIRAVLTDMMMPEMDGPSLVRALRHLEPQLPILGMTGVGEKADIKGLETLDLLVLLTKPFNSAVLLGVLHQALAAPRQANGKS